MSVDTLLSLKEFFDNQLNETLKQIHEGDSDRLIRNRVNGFLLQLHDKLLQIKPKLAC